VLPADPLRSEGELAARVLAEAIRFDTTNPPGNERPLAEYLSRVLRDEGIDVEVIATPSQGAPAGRAAVAARVAGNGGAAPIVLLSHLDVVPAGGAEWAVEPFGGVIAGGHVVGRGALDAKGIAVVHALALIELARRPTPLARDVILLAVPDEETGGRRGAGWLVRERPDLVRGARYVLAEGGAILPGQGSAPDLWGVAFAEKSPCWLELTARGRAGHGSVGYGDGAIPALLTALDRVRSLEQPVRVTPEVAEMFAALAPYAGEEDRAGLADLAEGLATDPEFRTRFLSEPGRAALVRNTVEVTVLHSGESTNVVPAEARAQLDARLLPGERCEAFVHRVRRAIADPSVDADILLDSASEPSPVATPLFQAIERVAARGARPAVVVPRVISGFTDAHWFRELGIVAYGFVPRWLDGRDSRGIHGPNERISLENLARGVDVLVDIVEELDRTEAAAR
jgi:acetylornithine deacetylase/succinyl-diaminopimelate desuccinylase-like protein